MSCQNAGEYGIELSLNDSFWHFFFLNTEILKQNHMTLKSVSSENSPVLHGLKWELGSGAFWLH